MDPVVELPVCKTKSLSPFDVNTPEALPVPEATVPFIKTVPSVELVTVSSFSRLKPAAYTVAPLS